MTDGGAQGQATPLPSSRRAGAEKAVPALTSAWVNREGVPGTSTGARVLRHGVGSEAASQAGSTAENGRGAGAGGLRRERVRQESEHGGGEWAWEEGQSRAAWTQGAAVAVRPSEGNPDDTETAGHQSGRRGLPGARHRGFYIHYAF